MTVFMVVGFVTFLDSLVSVAPAVLMMTSQQTAGDFDVQISQRSLRDHMVVSNQNFFTQGLEEFSQR